MNPADLLDRGAAEVEERKRRREEEEEGDSQEREGELEGVEGGRRRSVRR